MIKSFSSYIKKKLLLEYAEAFINNFAKKLAAEVGNPAYFETAKKHILYFDTVRSKRDLQDYVAANPEKFSKNGVAIQDVKNIEMYNAKQLSDIYYAFNPHAFEEEEEQKPITDDAELVFPEDPNNTIRELNGTSQAILDDRYLEIYYAKDQDACVKFSHDVFGKSYTYCVGRRDSSNMYASYRFSSTENKRASFYFVRDFSRPKEDNKHLVVVRALADGTFGCTNAVNSGETTGVSWEEVVKFQPKLAKHRDVIKFVPLTPREEFDANVGALDPNKFFRYGPNVRQRLLQSGILFPVDVFTRLSVEEQNVYMAISANNNNLSVLANLRTPEINRYLADKVIAKLPILNNIIDEIVIEDVYGSILWTIILLNFNVFYYIDNNNQVFERDKPRTQPLKYLANLLARSTRDISNHATEFENLTSVTHGVARRSYFLYKLKDGFGLAYSNTSQDYRTVRYNLLLLDSNLQPKSLPCTILSASADMFLVADANYPGGYAVSLSGGDVSVVHDTDSIDYMVDEDITANKIPQPTFEKLDLSIKENLIYNWLSHEASLMRNDRATYIRPASEYIVPKVPHHYSYKQRQYENQKLLNSMVERSTVLSAADKSEFKKKGITLQEISYRYGYAVAAAIAATSWYELCNSVSEDITQVFRDLILPLLKQHIYNHRGYVALDIVAELPENLQGKEEHYELSVNAKTREGMYINLNTLTIDSLFTVPYITQNAAIVADGWKLSAAALNPDKVRVVGITKRIDEDTAKQIKENYSQLYKTATNKESNTLKTAQNLISSLIKQDAAFNVSFLKSVVKAINNNTPPAVGSIPPFRADSRFSAFKTNKNTLYINLQGQQAAQDNMMYSIVFEDHNEYNAFSLLLKIISIFNIELAAVIANFKPDSYNQYKTRIGLLFAKRGANLNESGCDSNSFLLEIVAITGSRYRHTHRKLVARHIPGPILTPSITLKYLYRNLWPGFESVKHIADFAKSGKPRNIQNYKQKVDKAAKVLNQIIFTDPPMSSDIFTYVITHINNANNKKTTSQQKPKPQVQESRASCIPFDLHYSMYA